MRICVIALPRSGSSTLCRHLAQVNNLKNVGEVFRTATKNGLDVLKKDNIVYKVVPHNMCSPILRDMVSQETAHLPHYMRKIKEKELLGSDDNRGAMFKKYNDVMQDQALLLCEQAIALADKCYFLCRKDMKNQVLSFAALLQTGKGGKQRSKQVIIDDYNLRLAVDFFYNPTETPFIPVYNKLYSNFGGELIYTEDLPGLTNTAPYKPIEYVYNETIISGVAEFDFNKSS
jgi:hypothetical protein